MLALLDTETRLLHSEADHSWAYLLENNAHWRDGYCSQLAAAYGFEAPLEVARQYTPGLAQRFALPLHERTGLIVHALVSLGWTAEDITSIQCSAFSLFPEAPEALAWMYVVERSALIQAEVRQRLAIRFHEVAEATTGLAIYDGSASTRRAELGIALDHLCVAEQIRQRVVDAACTGYGALIEWQRSAQPRHRSAG